MFLCSMCVDHDVVHLLLRWAMHIVREHTRPDSAVILGMSYTKRTMLGALETPKERLNFFGPYIGSHHHFKGNKPRYQRVNMGSSELKCNNGLKACIVL
jgi:hypothetical protein